jgi:hypothetical protein
VVEFGKRVGVGRFVGMRGHEEGTRLSAELRCRLQELYRDDLVEFGRLTGQDLSSWTGEP